MSIKLTTLSHGGGCGCKIAPAVLSEILATLPAAGGLYPDLLVGTETSDDAAVYRLNDQQAIVATTDFFMPIVDDPVDFGRIAATNAISDIYAMGGKPILALAVVGMPIDKLPVEVVRDILKGGQAVCLAAGIPVAGGHSIDSPEPIYGLAVLGIVHPDKVRRNDQAKAGDVLILGKGVGIGVFADAMKKGKLPDAGYKRLVASTTQLNTPGTALAELPEVHAMTDVTGFGVLGHLLEICRGSQLGVPHRIRQTDPSSPKPWTWPSKASPPAPPAATGPATARKWPCPPAWSHGSATSSPTPRPAAACWWPATPRRRSGCWKCSATKASASRR